MLLKAYRKLRRQRRLKRLLKDTSREFVDRLLGVFGDEDRAYKWFYRPNRYLCYISPFEWYKKTPKVVEDELYRISHGIFM